MYNLKIEKRKFESEQEFKKRIKEDIYIARLQKIDEEIRTSKQMVQECNEKMNKFMLLISNELEKIEKDPKYIKSAIYEIKYLYKSIKMVQSFLEHERRWLFIFIDKKNMFIAKQEKILTDEFIEEIIINQYDYEEIMDKAHERQEKLFDESTEMSLESKQSLVEVFNKLDNVIGEIINHGGGSLLSLSEEAKKEIEEQVIATLSFIKELYDTNYYQ